jgi:hypothetical protein
MDDKLHPQTKMKRMKTELKWAIFYAIMTMAWSLTGKFLGFHDSKIAAGAIFNILIIVPSVIIYVLSMREKQLRYFSGHASYIQIFKSGVILTLFVTILGPIDPVFTNMISPDLFHNSIQFMVTSNQMTEADAVKQFTLPSFIVQGIFGSVTFGLIYAAIISIFLNSKSKALTNI